MSDKRVARRNPVIAWIDNLGRIQVLQAIWSWIGPLLPPVLVSGAAAVSGYIQHVPLMWIIMSASITFVAVLAAILLFYTFEIMTSPVDKLRFLNAITPCDLKPMRGNRRERRGATVVAKVTTVLDKMQVGIQVMNAGRFPLSTILAYADTELDGLKPPRTQYPKLPSDLHSGGMSMICDDPIDMNGRKCGNLQGRIHLKVKYGKRGQEKYDLEIKGTISVFMTQEGVIQQVYLNMDTNRAVT